MFLIVGLGNPGTRYQDTRHNAGFMVIDLLVPGRRSFQASLRHSLTCRTKLAGREVVLAKPQTFMNLSGLAVRELLEAYEVSTSRLLIVYDDVALPFGTLRVRGKGSAGGQKGMHSIISSIGTSEFARLRVGVGPPEGLPEDFSEFLLSPFGRQEAKALPEILELAAEAVVTILSDGLERAMARYNSRVNRGG